MGKVLAGVKYGKMTSRQKPPRNTKAQGKGSGRSGPPMVDIGAKGGRGPTEPSHRFARVGSVSERHGSTGPDSKPTIGSQSGHGGFGELGIPATPKPGKLNCAG